jgi:hypothetical protein
MQDYPDVSLVRQIPFYAPGQIGVYGADAVGGLRSAGGETFYVGLIGTSPNAHDQNDGTDPNNPKLTIQSALDRCTAGRRDTVVVLPGTHTISTQLTMTTAGVRLIGWDYFLKARYANSVILDGDGVDILAIDAANCEVAGFHFDQSDNALYTGIDVSQTTAVAGTYIHDCMFEMGLDGIVLGTAAALTPTNVLIERCGFFQVNNLAAASGIQVNRLGTSIIRDNVFYSNVANAAYGIHLTNQATVGVLISKNDFQFLQAGSGIFRAGTNASASMHNNRFSGTITPITVLIDGGDHAVENYDATAAGGALVDATT